MDKHAKIYVAGHNGMVGSAIVRRLQKEGYHNLVLRSSKDLDLRSQLDVEVFFETEQPEYVFLAAAKVGGILANNTYPAQFIYDNMMMQNNVIHAAHTVKVKKLLFLGSSCIYPKFAPQPIDEDALLTGVLEPTNEAYAIAKISGIKLCQFYQRQYGDRFISAMPTNLYGIGDNFSLEGSHVIPALIRKFDDAKKTGDATVTVWGSGTPMREFLYVDDLAHACLHLMHHYEGTTHLNVGTGEDITIRDLACLIQEVVGYQGTLTFDSTKPDGTPRKLLNVARIHASGWRHQTGLREGLENVYRWYQENEGVLRK